MRYTRIVIPSLLVATFIFACSSSDSGTTTTKKDAGAFTDGRTSAYPSFSNDVMAVMVLRCSLQACHGSQESNLNIYLPPDPKTCYAELMKTSPTTQLKFVAPGDPDNSYVMIKMDGKQATKCPGADCGTEMPPDTPSLLAPAERDAIRDWIKAGAKND